MIHPSFTREYNLKGQVRAVFHYFKDDVKK